MEVTAPRASSPAPPLIYFCLLVWATVTYPAVAVYQWISRVKIPVRESFIELGLYVTGFPLFISHSTIVPRYYIHVLGLTIWAYVTGKSFVIRYPNRPPRFIARRSSRDLRVFTITPDDIEDAYMKAAVPIRNDLERKWRPERLVAQRLRPKAPFYHPTPGIFDLRPYRLVGPRLVQGYGVIGHGIRLALIEEYGRWPNEKGIIAGRVFNWTSGNIETGKIPIKFVSAPGVEETVEEFGARIVLEWQDLEAGLLRGMRATAIVDDGVSVSSLDIASTVSSSSFSSTASTQSAASVAPSEAPPVLPPLDI